MQVLGWTGDTRVYASNSTTPLTWLSGAYLLGGGWNLSVYGDDFYCDVWEGADAPLMACPSSRRFLPAFPNGAGATAQWTPNSGANWQAVDEAPPDSETTYVKATVAGLRDSYSSVSYTHLDVYKRQLLRSSKPSTNSTSAWRAGSSPASWPPSRQ